MKKFGLIGLACTLLASRAAIADPSPWVVGGEAAFLRSVSVSGDVGGNSVGTASPTVGLDVFIDYQVLASLRVGVAVPALLNVPGPTSNAYDVGVAAHVVLDLPSSGAVHPFVSAEPGIMFSRLPAGEWWNGHALGLAGGLRMPLSSRLSARGAFLVALTSSSGDVNYPGQFDPLLHGLVKVAFIGVGFGLEVR